MYYWVTQFVTSRPVHGLPELMLIGCESQNSPDYGFAGRNRLDHPYCCFQYTLSGEGGFKNAEGEFRVPPGSGFLVEVADSEMEYFYPPEGSEPWKFIYVEFQDGNVKEIVREYTRLYGPVFSIAPDSEIMRTLLGYEREDGATLQLDAIESAELVNGLLLELGRSARIECENGDHSGLVRDALEIIQASLADNINASELAQSLGVSREHLARVFRRELHMSPYAFILDQRLQQACRLLSAGDYNNKEIAEKTGFGSDIHFSQLFKKRLGMTPREFRRSGVPLNRSGVAAIGARVSGNKD
jgi:AraC-like DNA-binding protein